MRENRTQRSARERSGNWPFYLDGSELKFIQFHQICLIGDFQDMSFPKILKYPESEILLRKKSINVKKIDKRVREIIQDLKDTLEDHGGGAGLAAPQIGIQLRIVVVRFGQDNGELQPALALINPKITKTGILTKGYDGCLSIPGLATWDTPRPSFPYNRLGVDYRVFQIG